MFEILFNSQFYTCPCSWICTVDTNDSDDPRRRSRNTDNPCRTTRDSDDPRRHAGNTDDPHWDPRHANDPRWYARYHDPAGSWSVDRWSGASPGGHRPKEWTVVQSASDCDTGQDNAGGRCVLGKTPLLYVPHLLTFTYSQKHANGAGVKVCVLIFLMSVA